MRPGRTWALLVFLSGCGQSPATVQYLTSGETSAVLAFVPITGGYQLVRCNSVAELKDNLCQLLSRRILTLEQLAKVRAGIEAELTASAQHHRWLLPAILAIASIVISRAVVRDLIKVVPITVIVGVALSYSQQELLRIIHFHDEKRVIVEELQNMTAEHRSSASLTIIEELLLAYLFRQEV